MQRPTVSTSSDVTQLGFCNPPPTTNAMIAISKENCDDWWLHQYRWMSDMLCPLTIWYFINKIMIIDNDNWSLIGSDKNNPKKTPQHYFASRCACLEM